MSAEREVIEHGVEIKHIQSDVDSIMEDMEQLKKRLDGIEKTLEEIRRMESIYCYCYYYFGCYKLDGNSLAR